MTRNAWLLLALPVVFLVTGCMTPPNRYEYNADKQIRTCDRLLNARGVGAADEVIRQYTRLLHQTPATPNLLRVHRRILLKRGEAYHLKGDKASAQKDFSTAARLARRIAQTATARPAAPAARPPASSAQPPASSVRTPIPPSQKGTEPRAAAPGEKTDVRQPPGLKKGAPPKRRKRPVLYTPSLELWITLVSNWSVIRDTETTDGTVIDPGEDLDCGGLTFFGSLRNRFSPAPRLSMGLDFEIGTVGGETDITDFIRYDGRVFPLGDVVETDIDFFSVTGLLSLSPRFPLPGTIHLELGAKYTSFSLECSFRSGGEFTDTIDAFFPVVGLVYHKELTKRLKLLLNGRLCGFYYSRDQFRVSTFHLEIFGGGEVNLTNRLYMWGGIRYTFSRYHLRSDGEAKELEFSQIGPAVALMLKI
jgi:hypothetical protein